MNAEKRIIDLLRSEQYKRMKASERNWLLGLIEGVLVNSGGAKPKEPREKRD